MRATITVLAGNAKPDFVEIEPDQTVSLGRSRENTIVIPQDEHASRLHAKIYFQNGRWMLHDYGLNGTRVHKERINHSATELEDGYEIRIGEVRFRFSLPDLAKGPSSSFKALPTEKHTPPGGSNAVSTTNLQLDELSALCQFMVVAGEATDAVELVNRGLNLVWHQTGACLIGYLSLDPSDPFPKLVLPDSAQVDAQLSRQLTRRVEIEKRTIWLGGDSAMTQPDNTGSLSVFQDAICIPLRAAGTDLGALHVYRLNSHFRDRDVRFCEALAGYLSHGLHVLKQRRTLEAENKRLRGHATTSDELLGDSILMMNLRSQIRRAASQPFTVLIQGEGGSGKELVASALHKDSPRSDGPLVVVNCGAIPASMIEAELFGYRRGSFTGALADHPGFFQQADEGTLFLDEIGELPVEFQPKLLRALETKSIRPLGGTNEIKVDVRIVAATNRNLEQEVRAGRFRSDLYFRLKVVPINVPPLREHPEDLPMLVQAFLDRLSEECHRTLEISEEAVLELRKYSWPGNVRQLRGLLESLAVMNENDTIEVDTVRRLLTKDEPRLEGPPSFNLEEIERWATERALKHTAWNVSQAATLLGISRDTLYSKIRKWGLQRDNPNATS